MSTAIAGLLGVIAGGVVTGGVQVIVAAANRRVAARTAARLLYLQLVWAENAMRAFDPHDEHPAADWDSFNAAWQQHREALAGGLSARRFQLVAGAFTAIQQLSRLRDDPPPRLLELYEAGARRAQIETDRASFTRWEWVTTRASRRDMRVPTAAELPGLLGDE